MSVTYGMGLQYDYAMVSRPGNAKVSATRPNCVANEKGKPGASRGRKATGLESRARGHQSAGLPEVHRMSYWDGSHWLPEKASTPAPRPSPLSNWAATAVMVIGLVALIVPLQLIAAASHRHADPGLTTSCGASVCTVGGSLTVSGYGFTPSAGGQQVILWVGYPDDYCVGTTICHGFYVDPWVASDGTFSATFSGVLLQTGTGQVKAIEYLPRPGRWDNVAQTDYSVQ